MSRIDHWFEKQQTAQFAPPPSVRREPEEKMPLGYCIFFAILLALGLWAAIILIVIGICR